MIGSEEVIVHEQDTGLSISCLPIMIYFYGWVRDILAHIHAHTDIHSHLCIYNHINYLIFFEPTEIGELSIIFGKIYFLYEGSCMPEYTLLSKVLTEYSMHIPLQNYQFRSLLSE